MRYSRVAGVAKPISRIVIGGDRLGSRRLTRPRDPALEQQTHSLLDKAVELGCNSFDTARLYGDSERTLGAWMRKRRNRDDVVIITKGCHPSRVLGRPRLSPSNVAKDLHASLKALETDFIDLYLLHYDNPDMDTSCLIEQLSRHVDEGKIGAIGVSNWSHERIEETNAYAAKEGLKRIVASSAQFSLADWTQPPWRGAVSLGGDGQRTARNWYSSHDVPVFAYSSLARGFFSDHYDPEKLKADRVGIWCAKYFGNQENIERLDRARTFAREHGVTVAQVALAYVLGHSLEPFAIIGASSIPKLIENVDALSIDLDAATLNWLSTGRNSG